jgi:hypothetical protein
MISPHQPFLPAIQSMTDQNIFVALLFVVGMFIMPKRRPKEDNISEFRKKALGTIHSLQDQLNRSESARNLLERDFRKNRSVSEERKAKIASLLKQDKSKSLSIHQLERDLQRRRPHRR